jgi:hypothetical protein
VESKGQYAILIVRIWRDDDAGTVRGVVENVKTGDKLVFHTIDEIDRAIIRFAPR